MLKKSFEGHYPIQIITYSSYIGFMIGDHIGLDKQIKLCTNAYAENAKRFQNFK